MSRHPVYDLLLADVTDELENKVLSVLIEHAGEHVSRPDMVLEVSGMVVSANELANCWDDRKNREAIKRLRGKGFPIVASSGEAGYALTDDEQALDELIAENEARLESVKKLGTALRSSRRWLKVIREYRISRANVATQISMFSNPSMLP